MKQITKESLATVFQITAIVFLFGYSFSSEKVGETSNAVTTVKQQDVYSTRLQQQMDNISAINLYYDEKKVPGLLYTRLNISADFIAPEPIAGSSTKYSAGYKIKEYPVKALYAVNK